MYLVVSYWEPVPGHEAQFEESGRAVREVLRSLPGVQLIEVFESNGKRVAVHGYKDEATYNSIVGDPNGPFSKAIAETHLEDHAQWISSDKGTTVEY